jgi:2-oxoglutarate dehydrogenase E2 component (dihydrolipoamide succinyltransferase)
VAAHAAQPRPTARRSGRTAVPLDADRGRRRQLAGGRVERRVPMTRLRARVAERLLDASRNTAMLTTFNEVDMQPVMDLRAKYKELFEKRTTGRDSVSWDSSCARASRR